MLETAEHKTAPRNSHLQTKHSIVWDSIECTVSPKQMAPDSLPRTDTTEMIYQQLPALCKRLIIDINRIRLTIDRLKLD